MDKKTQIDHLGKDVFVGIDVHRKTYTITALGEHMAYPFRVGGIPADPDKFCQWLIEKLTNQLTGKRLDETDNRLLVDAK